jgi:hypothetical protein
VLDIWKMEFSIFGLESVFDYFVTFVRPSSNLCSILPSNRTGQLPLNFLFKHYEKLLLYPMTRDGCSSELQAMERIHSSSETDCLSAVQEIP